MSILGGSEAVKPNIWEFVRNADGSYSISLCGELLHDHVPERWFDEEACVRYGFCGEELRKIQEEMQNTGKCTVSL